jgi:hypothetical protein
MFAPEQLLRNWYEWRPSNEGNFDPSDTDVGGRAYHTGV